MKDVPEPVSSRRVYDPDPSNHTRNKPRTDEHVFPLLRLEQEGGAAACGVAHTGERGRNVTYLHSATLDLEQLIVEVLDSRLVLTGCTLGDVQSAVDRGRVGRAAEDA